MKYSGRLGGGTPTIFKYQIGVDFPTVGVPALVAGSGQEGIQLPTTIVALNVCGLTLDTGVVLAAQQADGSDNERVVSVIANPDIIIRSKLSGGATANTALAEGTEATGSTTGLLVDTAVDYSSPSMSQGSLIGSLGANRGFVRKVTSLSTANAVPTVAFPNDIAIGDKFIAIPYGFSGHQGGHIMALDAQFVQLTALFDQVNAAVTIDTDNNNFIPLRLILPADPNKLTTQMFMDMIVFDHLYASS